MSLSISDFQKISNGSFNAGDITLTSSGKLDKVNNHVGILKGWNTKTISAATTATPTAASALLRGESPRSAPRIALIFRIMINPPETWRYHCICA